MDFDDAADLLGNHEMPVRQNGALQVLRALFHVTLALSLVAGLIVAIYNGHTWLSNWRENNYKKSVRRKYGIPDDDNEPFNVAYARAQARRKEMVQKSRQQQPPSEEKTASLPKESSSARQEGIGQSVPRRRAVPTGTDASHFELPRGSSKLFAPQKQSAEAPKDARVAPKTKSDSNIHDYAATSSQRKRSLEKDGADESSKVSRNNLGQDEPIAQGASVEDETRANASTGHTRGAKRQAASDEDIASLGSIGKKAGKRARRQSKKPEEVINIDENDEQMDVDHSISRGKKRDRAEAGSSFGGDDDLSAGGRHRKSKRQQRKTSAAVDKEGITPARGTKRSYEIESTIGSDEDDDSARARSPRKRGKRMAKESAETSVAGRKVGEEWHTNGVTYKVGSDGRRLRQVLLKKRASRYSMPEDSQHPDSQARLEILVETWLNDDEYKAAEKRGEIYIPNKKSKRAVESIPEAGKPLLWSSKQNATTAARSAFNHSIVINGKSTANPFERPSLTGNAKRISISLDSPVDSPITPPSPAMRPSKSYSKWEKQDLEAEAMARLRKKLEEEKKVSTPTPASKKVSFQVPDASTNSSTSSPSYASSPSAPASSSASEPSKVPTPAATPATRNLFGTLAVNADSAKAAATSNTSIRPAESAQLKPPTITLTPPKEPTSTPAPPKFTFGATPSGQAGTSSSQGTESTKPADRPAAPTNNFSSAPTAFGQKVQDTSNLAAGGSTANVFAKPAAPSNASTSGPSGTSGNTFSFGTRGAAQGEKATGSTPSFAFGKPAEKTVSPAPSPFSAPATAKDATASGTSNAISFGSNTGSAVQPASASATSGAATSAPQFSFGVTANKPAESSSKPAEQSGSGAVTTVPKFNFGFGSKPAAGPSTNQTLVATSAPKPATSTSAFPFRLGSTAQNAAPAVPAASGTSSSATGTTTPAPKFSFGQPAAQALSSTASAQAPTAFGNNTNSGNTGSATNASTTANAPTSSSSSSGFNFKYGAPSTVMSFSPSPFGNTASNPSPFGSTTSNPSPFGNTTGNPSPFGSTAKPSASPFGSTTSAFGNTSNTVSTSSSPFGQQAKPAGEAPKPAFGFGSNNASISATSSSTTNNQEKMPTFSFNFGAASTPAFGSGSGQPGTTGTSTSSPFGSAAPAFTFGAKPANSPFGAPVGSGNTNNSNASGTNAFGSNSGTSVFGQKS